MIRKIQLILFACLAVSSCAPNSARALKQSQNVEKVSFETPQNYQAAYRAIVTQARICFVTGMITAQMEVVGDLYTDIREGHITQQLSGGAGVDTYMTTDIKFVSEHESSIDIYAYFTGSAERYAALYKSWLAGGTSCT